jgi:hypothetical protein
LDELRWKKQGGGSGEDIIGEEAVLEGVIGVFKLWAIGE